MTAVVATQEGGRSAALAMAFVAAVEGAAATLRPVLSCAQQAAVRLGAWWRRATVAEQVRWRVQIAEELPTDLKELPLIHSNDSIKELNRSIEKHERRHDLVISSYTLGEIPSLNNRITIVRQLWGLTKDVLVLLEPGTPQGSKTIRQMRSCILWMEKRKCRKSKKSACAAPSKMKSMVVQEDLLKNGAFVVAPCESELHVV
ncbi:uncharacterized protein LOC119292750 [Triticum dicoccoides]|uniref:uncharacterized protein LOC119292750 n=1 Tax=Triticum dicoccoides TaxID=85692 RepID=UPI00188F2C8A|nr:uncharacterized protein LOC119292750 [Triticum dicoccoides]